MSSSDISVEQDEPDISLENSQSLSSDNSSHHSSDRIPEINDIEDTPFLVTTPSSNIQTTSNIDSLPLDFEATPSMTFETTHSINFTDIPSLDIEATPSLNLSVSPTLSLDTTPINIATDISLEERHVSIEQSEHVTEPQAELLEILSEVVTRAGEQTEVTNKTSVPFPLTRVKTIMKTDPDTSLIQADAVVLVGEAAKMFLKRFCRDAQKVTAGSKRKIVNRTDVDTCINRYDEYLFLEEQLDW
ncbi:DNA polymerase epsilon subunit 4-like [Oopsacas minuta]|uniref:DNA polymerase epsilon subunit 4-like n=1 Tax=Oopsacas minuta TaxID=111878 RepID=A0AAV7K003_9METZ|nr:DNA polymerase epsilon subunit 4-like [Oopsacas minuta]